MKAAAIFGVLCGCLIVVAVAAQAPPDRSKPPALGQPADLKLPPVQKRTLANGLPVWFVETHEVPIVQINLVVRAGSADDPAGKFGAGSLTAAMLDEGAGSRSALEIADGVEFLGATLSTTSSYDASAVRLNVPVARWRAAAAIMADVALRPTFPEEDLNRLREERLTALLQARDNPQTIAAMAFPRIVYGPVHRYGTGAVGTEATLKALTAADLRAFHTAFYQPANAALVVVGDVTPEDMLPELDTRFGAWKASGTIRRQELPAPPQPAGGISLIDVAGAEQSEIRVGWVGVPRSTPDYFPLIVLNTVLGGSFTSRLNQNLREEHGYAYGASSFFDMRRSAGPFLAAAGVQTDKTAESVREFFNELNDITKPVPSEELAKAKNYLALGYPSEFETSGSLARAIEDLIVYGLPDNWIDRYIASVQAVTGDAVQKAAARYIQPSRFAVVVVGDRQAVESGLRSLNLGPVRVMSVEEALGL